MIGPLPRATDPPLDPSGEEGRSLLREELADPQYYSDDIIQRALGWLARWLDGMLGAAAGASLATTAIAVVLALALAAVVLLLVTRVRRTATGQPEQRPALTDEPVTAAELRARAETALAAQRYDDGLVDAFRAVAVRQIERERIEDVPQATAHELAAVLADRFPAEAGAITDLADTFDAVLYGDHAASSEQVRRALRLDDHLGAVRR